MATFARFRPDRGAGQSQDPPVAEDYSGTQLIQLVAQLHPDLFREIDDCWSSWRGYLDPTLAAFERDVHFYLGYLDYLAPLRGDAGLSVTRPAVSDTDRAEQALDTFDLALARRLVTGAPRGARTEEVVVNDITLLESERVIVVSGPNNGGKTTVARTFGQLHYLARLGCPVPGRDVRLRLCDEIYTHFERPEDATKTAGRLQTSLNRLRNDLASATSKSVFVLNEIFNSATAADALVLTRRVLDRLAAVDALCLCVTFLDELADMDDHTASMVSEVAADDPGVRTFRVVRRPADGRAYARAIADRYGLGYDRLIETLRR